MQEEQIGAGVKFATAPLVAAEILRSLESECWFKTYTEQLSPPNAALLNDALGLLLGIKLSRIGSSQPRIRDNLINIIESISSDTAAREDAYHRSVVHSLIEIVHRVAACGISADGQSMAIARSNNLK